MLHQGAPDSDFVKFILSVKKWGREGEEEEEGGGEEERRIASPPPREKYLESIDPPPFLLSFPTSRSLLSILVLCGYVNTVARPVWNLETLLEIHSYQKSKKQN